MKTIKLHSCNIILSDHWVGLKSPLEWSMTNDIMLDSGLSTVWTGGLYIPGKSSIPNESENHPATILVFTCSLRNSCSFFGLQQMPQFMPQFWISSLHCVSKWPETLAESDEDRVNKRAILVVSEQSLKYALGSPAALLRTCQTSRNLNFLNWSSNTLLTDPDQQWITLSRLRM